MSRASRVLCQCFMKHSTPDIMFPGCHAGNLTTAVKFYDIARLPSNQAVILQIDPNPYPFQDFSVRSPDIIEHAGPLPPGSVLPC